MAGANWKLYHLLVLEIKLRSNRRELPIIAVKKSTAPRQKWNEHSQREIKTYKMSKMYNIHVKYPFSIILSRTWICKKWNLPSVKYLSLKHSGRCTYIACVMKLLKMFDVIFLWRTYSESINSTVPIINNFIRYSISNE